MNRPDSTTAEPERQAAELAAMRRMIEASRGCFSLSIAICNSPALRDYLIAEIRKLLPGLGVVAIPRGTVDIYGHVIAEVLDTPPDALFIVNLESSVPSNAKSQQSLRSLNASRELWQQRYQCPVVFWLPEYATTLLATHAPDFWRYRSHRFELISEQAGLMEGLADRSAGDLSAAASLSAEEKRFRIAELEQRIAEAGDPPPPELAHHVAVWLKELGFLYAFLGDLSEAEKAHKRSLLMQERLDRREGVASQYCNLGQIYETRGELDRAEEMFREALAIGQQLGRQEIVAASHGNLGEIYRVRGELASAEDMYRKALAIEEQLGRQEHIAKAYCNLGTVSFCRGELDRAAELYDKGLAISGQIDSQLDIARTYANLGSVYASRGELDRAEEITDKALTIFERLGYRDGIAIAYENLAIIYRQRGDCDKARDCLAKALILYRNIGNSGMVQTIQNRLQRLRHEESHR